MKGFYGIFSWSQSSCRVYTRWRRLDFRVLRQERWATQAELRRQFDRICVWFLKFLLLHCCFLCLLRSESQLLVQQNGQNWRNLKWKMTKTFVHWAPCRHCRNAAAVHESLPITHYIGVNATVEDMMNISSKTPMSCLLIIQHDILIMQIVQIKHPKSNVGNTDIERLRSCQNSDDNWCNTAVVWIQVLKDDNEILV